MVKKAQKPVKKVARKSTSRVPTTFDDFKSAALLVSVTINLAIFVGWLAIQLTTKYDAQVIAFLFNR